MRLSEDFFKNYVIEKLSKGTEEHLVLAGEFPLILNGLVAKAVMGPDIFTTNIALKDIRIYTRVKYYYVPTIDTEHYVRKYSDEYPNILIPTKERALIECIKYKMDYVDEGVFIEAMYNYITLDCDEKEENYALLNEVADFFEVPWDKVKYWIAESYDFAIS